MFTNSSNDLSCVCQKNICLLEFLLNGKCMTCICYEIKMWKARIICFTITKMITGINITMIAYYKSIKCCLIFTYNQQKGQTEH